MLAEIDYRADRQRHEAARAHPDEHVGWQAWQRAKGLGAVRSVHAQHTPEVSARLEALLHRAGRERAQGRELVRGCPERVRAQAPGLFAESACQRAYWRRAIGGRSCMSCASADLPRRPPSKRMRSCTPQAQPTCSSVPDT